MNVKYLTCSVILCACTKFSPHRSKARKLIGGTFLIPESVFEMTQKVAKRRSDTIYPNLFRILKVEDMIGKCAIDFKKCFTIGSTSYYADNYYLENMFDQILAETDTYETDRFDKTKAIEFRRMVHLAIRENRVHLGIILKHLEDGEYVFEIPSEREMKTIYSPLMKRFGDPEHKFEMRTIAECLVHGTRTGMDFSVICAEPSVTKKSSMKKVRGVLKNKLGLGAEDLVVPIEDIW